MKYTIMIYGLIDRRGGPTTTMTAIFETRAPTADTKHHNTTVEGANRVLRKELEAVLTHGMNEANRQGFEMGPETQVIIEPAGLRQSFTKKSEDHSTKVTMEWLEAGAERLLNCNAHIAPEDVPMKKQKLEETLADLAMELVGKKPGGLELG